MYKNIFDIDKNLCTKNFFYSVRWSALPRVECKSYRTVFDIRERVQRGHQECKTTASYLILHFYILVNGGWGSWTTQGTCSKTCGVGVQSRSRTCDNPAPAHSGSPCSGSSSGTESCNLTPCPGIKCFLIFKLFIYGCYISHDLHRNDDPPL